MQKFLAQDLRIPYKIQSLLKASYMIRKEQVTPRARVSPESGYSKYFSQVVQVILRQLTCVIPRNFISTFLIIELTPKSWNTVLVGVHD